MVLIFLAVGAGGLGGEAPQLSRGVWGAARPPNREKLRGGGWTRLLVEGGEGGGEPAQWILGGDVTSGGD